MATSSLSRSVNRSVTYSWFTANTALWSTDASAGCFAVSAALSWSVSSASKVSSVRPPVTSLARAKDSTCTDGIASVRPVASPLVARAKQ